MRYSRVHIDAIGYELPPVVVTSQDLEDRLSPVFEELRIPEGQLEAWTGIVERRWWEAGYPLSQGAIAAAKKAIQQAGLRPQDIEVLIYAGVCRENFEPATACRVAAGVGVSSEAAVYDISNACLGVLNGIVDIANRIELGQIQAGLVVSCETAREINDIVIERLLSSKNMELFKSSLATLTGGSGAVAVLLTDGSFSKESRRRLVGGVTKSAPEHHGLCRWGIEAILPAAVDQIEALLPAALALTKPKDLVPTVVAQRIEELLPARLTPAFTQFMATDSISVLRFGVDLGLRSWKAFQSRLGWGMEHIDKVICHQVGSGHRDSILQALGIPHEKEFSTFPYLGNIGTVSLPLTAALAEERDFLKPGDRVGFLGIGSGLNCLMLGLEW
ncbi:MAG: 3-oxoacyl-ACP synthase III [Planctomycetota bacterium]